MPIGLAVFIGILSLLGLVSEGPTLISKLPPVTAIHTQLPARTYLHPCLGANDVECDKAP